MHRRCLTSFGYVRSAQADQAAHETRLRNQRGLTAIELLIVTVIIGIIAAVSIVSVAGALDNGRQKATVADMRALAKAIATYAVDHNDPPADTDPFAIMVEALAPYYSSALPVTDHWGYSYEYKRDAAGNYTLQSFGKDGIDGADVTKETRSDYDRDLVINNGIFVAAPS